MGEEEWCGLVEDGEDWGVDWWRMGRIGGGWGGLVEDGEDWWRMGRIGGGWGGLVEDGEDWKVHCGLMGGWCGLVGKVKLWCRLVSGLEAVV